MGNECFSLDNSEYSVSTSLWFIRFLTLLAALLVLIAWVLAIKPMTTQGSRGTCGKVRGLLIFAFLLHVAGLIWFAVDAQDADSVGYSYWIGWGAVLFTIIAFGVCMSMKTKGRIQ